MALIIEDGTIVTNANSYVTTTELTNYVTARGVTLTGDEESLLIQAMDYLETLLFAGYRFTRDQALSWPRANVYIDGYLQDADVIPTTLKNAQMQLAMAIDVGNGPFVTVPRATKRTKVGSIEVEYADNAASMPIVKSITAMLTPILANGSTGGFIVSKA